VSGCAEAVPSAPDYVWWLRSFALLAALLCLVGLNPSAAGPHNARCQRLLAMKIFSHCGRSGLENETALVSEASVRRLHARGIAAFDMDIFWTTDNELFVGHPTALRHLYARDVFELSSAAVRNLSSGRMLTATRLLELAGSLHPRLHIALDLKGDARPGYLRHLAHLHSQVRARGLSQHVWLWANKASSVARVRKVARESASNPLVLFGKPIKDVSAPTIGGRAACSGQVSAADEAQFFFLGPSRQCANAYLLESQVASRWRATPFFYLVWNIDHPSYLEQFVMLDVDQVFVISNFPLRLQGSLDSMRAREC
jgi:hypothetical protein